MKENQTNFQIIPIGSVKRKEDGVYLELDKKYAPAIKELNHFSHVQVLWWADKHDNEKSRNIMQITPPYGKNPPVTGVFATRAEYRPNPIGITVAKIEKVNVNDGIVKVQNLDAFDGTPIIDLKAYFPVCDRVKDASIPKWLVGWPEWFPEEGFGLS
ncbi:MAG: tRNA (N6-threonylcarbamoyladenosine(37)-N6)-methyltransferase TrmO [Candidatus Heimdallarchaeota archaeon]|nr:tRNA (N6-threonylcarbamoyladenosine(37)-N6)-methyltransferase TrmO [Candidatus Heimdallarchaeota archaeon]